VASIGALIIDLIAKTAGFETDMGRAARTAEKRSNDIEKSMSRLSKRISGALAGIAAGFSVAKIIQATSEAEKALAALDNAVRNNAGAAGATTKQLADFSGELQKLTTFSDDSIQGMQALLLSFQQISGGEFKRAQVAVLDLATALGKDLNSSALLVGRALADPIKGMTALGRAGVVLSKEQQGVIKSLVASGRSAEAQGIILQELENRYGGAAQAARNTFGGALAGLKNAFDDLLEVKSGLPGSIDAINEFTAVLQDPATSAAVDTLTSGIITGFASAAKALASFAGGIKTLSEELAAAQYGAAADDLVRLNEQLELAQNIKAGKTDRLRFFGKDGIVEWYSDAELDQEIKRLKGLIENGMAGTRPPISTSPNSVGAASGPSIPLPPTEEFTKFAAKLNEQIALHGKVGEAAKLAYAIQSGALEELSDSEEKQLMVLARRADVVAANTEAQKQAAEAQKKALADQQQAKESIDSMVSALHQQVATYEQGEAAVIRYRIEHGDLADTFAKVGSAADPYKEELIGLTAEMEALTEATKRQDEAQKQWEAAVAKGAAIAESVRTPLEDYQSTLVELNDALNLGVISQETYSRALEKAQDSLDEATNKWTVFKDQAARNTQDIIADTLVNGFDDGAEGILNSFADMLKRMAAQAIAADIASKIFGNTGSGGSGGSGGWIDAAMALFGGGKATGGPVTAGMMYRVNEREPEYFKPNVGGKVIPLSKMPNTGGVNVVNNFNIQAPQGTVSRQTQMQVAASAAKSLQSANRKNN
jgi:hypothetical protein